MSSVRLVDVNGRPLRLTPEMDAVGRDVLHRYGAALVVFTSGRRANGDQARAMAQNVVQAGRQWIVRTYRPSGVRDALEKWLYGNAWARTASEIAIGFENVLADFTSEELRRLSLHLSGEAFDLRPQLSPAGQELNAHLRERADIKFLDREGGLIRWHCQRRGVA